MVIVFNLLQTNEHRETTFDLPPDTTVFKHPAPFLSLISGVLASVVRQKVCMREVDVDDKVI